MISLEQFKLYYEPIIKYNKEFSTTADALDTMFPSSYVVPELGSHLLDSYIEMLTDIMEDSEDFIAYYVFECEDGKKPMKVTIPDGDSEKEILLDSLDKLYEIIMWENEHGND